MRIQRGQIGLFFAFLCVAALFAVCLVTSGVASDTMVHTDIAVADASARAVRTIEAENCEQCTTGGHWKYIPEWGVITNEHTETVGLALPATLTLAFQGTGISIVYRQDHWYGALRAEIDGQAAYCLGQEGSPQEHVEACFKLGAQRTYTLSLSAAEPASIVTGVITLDAFKILEGDEPCDTVETLCGPGLLVPAYFSPTVAACYWSQLAEAARKLGPRLMVIGNVNSGPGTEFLQDYHDAFNAVVNNGGMIIGYVYTCFGNEPDETRPWCPRPEGAIEADIDSWYEWYKIDGIFFDEVASTQDKVSFYQELYRHVQERQSGDIVVNNFGREPHPDYSGIGSSILCTFEGNFDSFVPWTPPTWITSDRLCALVYNTSSLDWSPAMEHLREVDVDWFYFTSDIAADHDPTMPNEWNILPPYFQQQLNRLCRPYYLPAVWRNYLPAATSDP